MKRSDATRLTQRAAIYRGAAKLIEKQTAAYPGFAIWMAHGTPNPARKIIDPFEEIFTEWVGDRDERIVALCFMAAMVEVGDA